MNRTPEQKARLDIVHGFADYLPFVSMITGMKTRFINGLDSVMTNPDIAVTGEVEGPESGAGASGADPLRSPQRSSGSPFARPLPHVRVGGISGLLELVAKKRDGDGSIPQLAQRLQLEVDDLLPLLDAAVLLGFATTTILRSKDLFRQQAMGRGPVLSSIAHTLQEKENWAMRSDFFLGIWDDYFLSVLMWPVPPPPD